MAAKIEPLADSSSPPPKPADASAIEAQGGDEEHLEVDDEVPKWLMTVNSVDPIQGLPEDSSSRPLTVDVEFKSVRSASEPFRIKALLDTGAARSFVRSSTRNRIPADCIIESRTFVTVANVHFDMAADLSCGVILGMQALRSLALLLYLGVVSTVAAVETGVTESVQSDAFFELCSPNVASCDPLDYNVLNEVSCPSRSIRERVYDVDAAELGDEPSGDNSSEAVVAPRRELSGNEPEKVAENGISVSPFVETEGTLDFDNRTLFRGLTPSQHFDVNGVSGIAFRYTYGVPWASGGLKNALASLCSLRQSFDKDRRLVQRLVRSGLLSDYSAVFERYESIGAIVRLQPGEYPLVASIIDHFPVLNPSSKSSPVRPVLNGLHYKGVIGSGQGQLDRSPLTRSKRGVLPALFTFRAFPYVGILDLECAFYMLENDPQCRYGFYLVWQSEVYRLRGPPMGSPHSPACLNDALKRLVTLAEHKLPGHIKAALLRIREGKGSAIDARDLLLYGFMKPYMDDIVMGSNSRVGLESGLEAFLRACVVRGFNSQERKRQLGPPPPGKESHVLGLDWLSNDRLRAQKADLPLPPLEFVEVDGKTVSNVTCWDILAVINSHFDPLGSHSNILLAMRYTLRSEISKGLDGTTLFPFRRIGRLNG
ncbi:hypothetical protein FOZ61_008861 [Perkinsus olseni]|uniref:Uncharacterized protein n=1 Tax=Perkinsus olseni TaxID=32597 RepID=A0A7J6L346_PEROL|nr:hypothetical protein FOZ61_008861 [Perkinsus olseni]